MPYKKYLEDIKFAEYLEDIKNKIVNKKIILYGDGKFFLYLHENTNCFEKLNIIAISDRKYNLNNIDNNTFCYKKILIDDINNYNPDCILVTLLEYENVIKNLKKQFPDTLVVPIAKRSIFHKFKMKYIKNYYNIIYLVENTKKIRVKKISGFNILFSGNYNVAEFHCKKDDLKQFKNCTIEFANNNKVVINPTFRKIDNMKINLQSDCCFTLNENVYSLGFKVLMEKGTKCTIGKDSYIGWGTCIRTGDAHKIYDSNGKRLNDPADVKIGNNVWIGQECLILKNTNIPNHCVVAARSITNKEYCTENVLIAGAPAIIKKRNIFWTP